MIEAKRPFCTVASSYEMKNPLSRICSGTTLLFVLGSSALVACERSPIVPGDEVYALATVNGSALPATLPSGLSGHDVFEATAGTLTLRANGTVSETLTIRCRSPLPPGTTCEVTGDGRVTREGTYDRAEGRVLMEGRSYPATFEDHRVVITYVLPPSSGFSPGTVLDFRR